MRVNAPRMTKTANFIVAKQGKRVDEAENLAMKKLAMYGRDRAKAYARSSKIKIGYRFSPTKKQFTITARAKGSKSRIHEYLEYGTGYELTVKVGDVHEQAQDNGWEYYTETDHKVTINGVKGWISASGFTIGQAPRRYMYKAMQDVNNKKAEIVREELRKLGAK